MTEQPDNNMSKSHAREVARLERTKATWQMTVIELAKIYAAHRGYYSREGGWIYNAQGVPIEQGWQAFANRLTNIGHIRAGVGINWRKSER